MASTTDNIRYPAPGDTIGPLAQRFENVALDVQAAFDKRERFEFVWPGATERAAQLGMVEGSRGYQVDTKTEYLFESGAWRLAVPYVEYSSTGQSVANATYVAATPFVRDDPRSTSTLLVDAQPGIVTIKQPGVYGINWVGKMSGGAGAGGFITITPDLAHADWYSLAPFTSGVATIAIPFLRTTVADTPLYLWVYQNSGAAKPWNSRLSIGRFA